jgi:SAM-dependent methyltransferase
MANAIYIHDEITHNSSAAEQVLPLLFETYKPTSIIDVGCGLGNWIEVAKRLTGAQIIGVDGDYVDRSLLKIGENEFVEKDLTKPFDLNKKFDLAICLEVAEHLPEASAEGFIKSITNHSDVIMFSAALPGQGGQNHINEQWPSYWQEHFNNCGFEMIDFFRFKIWNNTKIEYWYKQNLFLVVRKGHKLAKNDPEITYSLVHPELLALIHEQYQNKVLLLQGTIHKLKKRDIIGRFSKFLKNKKK